MVIASSVYDKFMSLVSDGSYLEIQRHSQVSPAPFCSSRIEHLRRQHSVSSTFSNAEAVQVLSDIAHCQPGNIPLPVTHDLLHGVPVLCDQ